MIYSEHLFNENKACLLFGKTYTEENGSVAMPWNDSGFAFRFYGTGFILHFAPFADPAVPYVRVWLDGCAKRFAIANGNEKVIYEDLEEGVHTVRVMRIVEGMECLYAQKVTLMGNAPAILDAPQERPLRLAFIGDSITCGYGVLGNSATVGYVTYEQDSSRSYAYMTADLLNAEVQLSGASGKGIVSNCNGNREDMTLRQAFAWKNRQGGQWDHSTWIPDLTVINAGTNDAWGGVGDEEFVEVAKKLLGEVRTAYPEKPIIWCYGVMDQTKMGAVEKAVTEFNAEYGNAYYLGVESMHQVAGEIGGGGHPNLNTSKRVSALLAEKIRSVLNK